MQLKTKNDFHTIISQFPNEKVSHDNLEQMLSQINKRINKIK